MTENQRKCDFHFSVTTRARHTPLPKTNFTVTNTEIIAVHNGEYCVIPKAEPVKFLFTYTTFYVSD